MLGNNRHYNIFIDKNKVYKSYTQTGVLILVVII